MSSGKWSTITVVVEAASEDEAREKAMAQSSEIDVSEWTARVESHGATHIEELS